MNFYKWKEHDFIRIRASQIQRGDEIAYGKPATDRYGAIPIANISPTVTDAIVIEWFLPPGLPISSSHSDAEIDISWKGTTPIIRILQLLPGDRIILIRDPR